MRRAGSITAVMLLARGSARAFRAAIATGVPRRGGSQSFRRSPSCATAMPSAYSWARTAITLRAGASAGGGGDGVGEGREGKPVTDGLEQRHDGEEEEEEEEELNANTAVLRPPVFAPSAPKVTQEVELTLIEKAIPPMLAYEMEQEKLEKAEMEAKRLEAESHPDTLERKQNPMLQQEGLPKFETISTESARPAFEILLRDLEEGFAEFEEDLINYTTGNAWGIHRMRHDYAGVVERQEQLGAPLLYAWRVLSHLSGVKNSESLREVYQELQPKVVTLLQKLGQSTVVYNALKFLQLPSSTRLQTEAQMRVVDRSVMSMELAGVGLDAEAKEEFNKIQLELAELSMTFSNNILDSTKAFSLTLTDKADVDGLPASALALAAQSAKTAGTENATPESGPWRLTLEIPSYLPSMQHLKSRSVREKLYRAFVTRASSLMSSPDGKSFDNEPLIARILRLKKRKAELLGYKSYAEVSLVQKMAGSVDTVDELSGMLREKSYPAAQKELEDLKAYAEQKGHEGEVELWDVTYWAERRKEELYDFSEEELRAYFPLPNVLEGMFGLAKRLFGVSITPADGEAEVWHPDVRFFSIKDSATEEHMANFYLDPYSRPADKRGGAWMDVCLGRSQAIGVDIPVAYLTCNGSPPVGNTPSLMTFREVETLFHEFGHGLQHMLTKMVDGECAGINGVEWDAVELPSQFMENWCYHQPTVDQFARNYETGQSLPSDLFNKLLAQRTYMAGTAMLRQLCFGQMDMELHHRYDPTAGDETVFDVQRRVSERFSVMPPLPEDRFLCAFSHIFAGGYSAGYYSYKYAEVMSADAFAAFEEAGLDDEEAMSAVGMRFKDTVLAMGGGKHPAQVYRDFRGRDPTPEALLRHCGFTEAEPQPERELAGAGAK